MTSRKNNRVNIFQKIRNYLFLIKNNFTLNPKHIIFLIKHSLALLLLNIETKEQFKNNFGDFNWERDCRKYRLMNPGSEGGAIIGDVVLLASRVNVSNQNILLAGDRNVVKEIWKPFFKDAKFITAGLHEMDIFWDYELEIPEELAANKFKLIISQATLEHLINPYKHFCDLVSLLDFDGYLIIQTVLPGFFYHRVPIDCFRFYPDWFEVLSQKLNLDIIDKQISVFSITYKFKKSKSTPQPHV